MNHYSVARALFVVLVFAFEAWAQSASDPVAFYRQRVKPILEANCYACHAQTALGGLRVDSREALVRGGKRGPAVVPGKPDEGWLLRAVTHGDSRLKMPPNGKLAAAAIADLRAWIEAGAHGDGAATGAAAPPAAGLVTPERRAFWSFQPIRKPEVPDVRDKAWGRTPIDAFILARLEERSLSPAPPADRRTWLRRVTLDLTGLPPTPEETDAFLQDSSPEAAGKTVDRLLASPRYGERWGRHWLDVVRYAEDDALGLAADPYPNAYRYRDWVIRALNEDMPYDLFVKAQIAGDLLEPPEATRLKPALGMFGLGPWYYKLVEPPQAQADELHDRVDALTRGFLGLTVACARCHDHKYDPITVRDYYALAGVFFNTKLHEHPLAPPEDVKRYHDRQKQIEALEAQVRESLGKGRQAHAEALSRDTPRYLMAARAAARGTVSAAEAARRDGLDASAIERWKAYLVSPAKAHPFLGEWEALDPREEADPAAREAASAFGLLVADVLRQQREIEEYNRKVIEASKNSKDPYDLFCTGCNAETRSLPRDRFVLWTDLFGAKQRSQDDRPGVLHYAGDDILPLLSPETRARVEQLRAELKAAKAVLPPRYPFLHAIADVSEPTDMRIHLRGSPYSPGDSAPRRFLEVLGRPEPPRFQQGSGRAELAAAIASADNPLTARVIVNRLWHHHFGAGLVRTPSNFGQMGDRPSHPELLDYLASSLIEQGWSLKKLHKEIVLSATYGTSSKMVARNQEADPDNRLYWRANRRRLDVEALRDTLLFAAGNLDAAQGGPALEWDDQNRRRTVYGKVSRYRTERLLTLFDFPDPTMTAEQRVSTQTPLQWLFYLNSEFLERQSEALATRVCREAGAETAARVGYAYRLLYSRRPGDGEMRLAARFLGEQPAEETWRKYVQVLLSSNELAYVD